MISKLLLDVKGRLASHLETRDIRIMLSMQKERGDKTLAMMEKYSKFLSNPTSSVGKDLYASISKETVGNKVRPADVYSGLLEGMKLANKRVANLVTLYENNNHRVLMSSNLSTINANALHLAAICDFYEKSSRALVLGVSELESAALRGIAVPSQLRRYISANFASDRIRSLASILSYNRGKKNEDIVKAISEMDDVEVTEETLQAAQAMGGAKRIDPSGFNYLNVFNPTFWAYVGIKSYSNLRLLWLEMEKDELNLLELRHQELAQLKRDGDSDMATDQLITKLKDRIDIKRYDIKELEDSLG